MGTIGTDADVVRRGTSADPTAPPPRRRLPWRSLLLVAVLVVLLSAIAGALSGWRSVVTAGQLPSGEQSQVLADLGVPEVFAVSELAVDGEIDGVVRLERWGYPDLGRMVVFIDGVRAAEGPLPMPEAGWPRSPDRTVDPTLLHHELSDEERSDLLGPPADRLPESGTEGVASLDADLVLRYHPETDVLVLERAGRLVSAQTLGVGPS